VIFKIYKDTYNQWRWLLLNNNHNITAISAVSYINRQECLRAISDLKDALPIAPIIEDDSVKHSIVA